MSIYHLLNFSTESVEKEISKLRHEIEDLEKSVKIDPDIAKLETQNNKLKYQVIMDIHFIRKFLCSNLQLQLEGVVKTLDEWYEDTGVLFNYELKPLIII